jgi:pyruvate-formate lyase-activating enzyme
VGVKRLSVQAVGCFNIPRVKKKEIVLMQKFGEKNSLKRINGVWHVVPKRLLLECTNVCNATCGYCQRSEMERPVFHLDINLYRKWVKNSPFVEWIQPQGIGEPLMYPHIIEALDYAKRQGHKTMFYTNASLLTRRMTELLLDVQLDSLTFSVDGYNEHTFQTRTGLKWKPVLENVVYFQKRRDQIGGTTKTQIRGTITRKNRLWIPRYYWFWHGKVDVVTMMNLIQFPTPQEIDLHPFTQGPEFSCYHIFPEDRPLTPAITVLNNGNVVVCCQDWFSDYVCANLHDMDPLRAFNTAIYNKIRGGMETGQHYPLLCDYCRLGKIKRNNPPSFWRYYAKISNRVVKKIRG